MTDRLMETFEVLVALEPRLKTLESDIRHHARVHRRGGYCKRACWYSTPRQSGFSMRLITGWRQCCLRQTSDHRGLSGRSRAFLSPVARLPAPRGMPSAALVLRRNQSPRVRTRTRVNPEYWHQTR